MLYRTYSDLQRRKEFGISWLSVPALESLIPPQPNRTGPGDKSVAGIMQYPEDWAQLSLRRTHEAGFAESVANRRVARVLNHTKIPVDFQRNTFGQVASFLSQVSGENIYVDWKALDFIGVSADDEITLQLNDITLAAALDRVLEQVGDDLDRPQWSIQDGMVTVSSEQALRKHIADFEGCYKGFVTDLARRYLESQNSIGLQQTAIFACGPTAMLKAVAMLAAEFDLRCQVSLEEFMACAVGGCAGCAVRVETKDGPAMKRVCVDGPVFEASTVFN